MNTAKKLAQLGCGNEMIQSCIDRGNLHASIWNLNQAMKYMKRCILNYKESKDKSWIEFGIGHVMPFYNRLLEIQHLAELYHELWKEKYYKAKLQCEKLLNDYSLTPKQ